MILIIVPIVIQFVLTSLRISNRIKIPIWSTSIFTFFLGVLMAIGATTVSTYGFGDPKKPIEFVCATGAGAFLFLGILITIIATPVIGIIGTLIYRKNERIRSQVEFKQPTHN